VPLSDTEICLVWKRFDKLADVAAEIRELRLHCSQACDNKPYCDACDVTATIAILERKLRSLKEKKT
jgi:hypothetical protein